MTFARVEQRDAHLAGPVRLEFINGREGKLAKATLTAISNTRHGTGNEREDETTAILWTLWGRQAENAAAYLGKGSHVNVVGRRPIRVGIVAVKKHGSALGADLFAAVSSFEDRRAVG